MDEYCENLKQFASSISIWAAISQAKMTWCEQGLYVWSNHDPAKWTQIDFCHLIRHVERRFPVNTILASKTDVKTINFKNGEFYSGVWTAYSEWHCMSFWGSRILIKCNYEKNLVEHNYWNRHLIGVKILKLNDYLIFMQNIFLECEQLKSNTVFWLQIICLRKKKKRESRFSLIELDKRKRYVRNTILLW